MSSRVIVLVLSVALVPWAAVRPARAAEVGGVFSTGVTWNAAGNPWMVTGEVTVADAATLTIEAGVRVELDPQVSVIARGGGRIEVLGDAGHPVEFQPRVPGENWGRIGAEGAGSGINMRHAEVAGGQGAVLNGASGLFESCFFHDYNPPAGSPLLVRPILVSEAAETIVVRACRVRAYHETLFRHGVITIEDCLFEEVGGDGIDFDTASPGSVIRRCTFRHGAAVNVDAVDLGSGTRGTEVSHCLIYDFPFDKGISIGERSSNIVVRSCLIYRVNMGVAVKDSSDALIVSNTVAGSDYALRFYQKTAGQGPGHATGWNNILWSNAVAVELRDGSTLDLTCSDVQGGYHGAGNLDVDPLFRNAASNDYRLGAASPCIGTGTNGTPMGAAFPVGSFLVDSDGDGLPDTWETTYGLDFNDPDDAALDPDGDRLSNGDEFLAGTAPNDPDSVLKLASIRAVPAGTEVALEAVEGKTYTVQHRDDWGPAEWQALENVPAQPAPTHIVIVDPAQGTHGRRFYRVVTPALE